MLPRHPAWAPKASVPDEAGEGATCGRIGRRFAGPSTPGKRWWKESVSAAVDQPHSQAAVRADWTGCDGVCRTWSEIGVRGCAPAKHSVTAAAAFGGAAGAWLQKVKLSRIREGQPTHAIGEARLI